MSTHDKLSAAGKKGAATRWSRAKKRVKFYFAFVLTLAIQVFFVLGIRRRKRQRRRD